MTEWDTPNRLPISHNGTPTCIHATVIPLSLVFNLCPGGMVESN